MLRRLGSQPWLPYLKLFQRSLTVPEDWLESSVRFEECSFFD